MARRPLPAYPVNYAELPPNVVDLIELIGWPKTSRLVQEIGGTCYPIPHHADANPAGAARYERLVELIGVQATRTLQKHYRGERLLIPRCTLAFARARMRAIHDFCRAGGTIEEAALHFDVSVRWVSYAIERAPLLKSAVTANAQQLTLDMDCY